MNKIILPLNEINRSRLAEAGGKAANLGELTGIAGVAVPEGFCITTEACRRLTADNEQFHRLLDELSRIQAQDRQGISHVSTRIRAAIEATPIPEELRQAVAAALSRFRPDDAFAVRSSATAEDLPTASFAGQQDTFLNIIGQEAILNAIVRCWASLFSERAVSYRMENGFDHRQVLLAVVVQKMVFAEVSGIMFTADPLSANRKVLSIDASFGLGEALVSGRVNADVYKVRDGVIADRKISEKKLAVYALKAGGVAAQELNPEMQRRQALSDDQIRALEAIGRNIEAHFHSPQDIEWCLADGRFYVVQSRPITTLFPVPEVNDAKGHVYLSVGHQQMMTDAMKPLGLDMWYLISGSIMAKAGGRLFVDVAAQLASPARDTLINVLGKYDPLTKNAMQSLLRREGFLTPGAAEPAQREPAPDYQTLADFDADVVADLIRNNEAALEALKRDIQTKSGPALFDFILEDIAALRTAMKDPRSFGVIMTGMNAAAWINEKMEAWLGEKSAADVLAQSLPGNVTSEMGLALLDVADAIRPYPEVIAFLQQVHDDDALDGLSQLEGGAEALRAIRQFLDRYGMRCPGEIDITRDRWSEKPALLAPLILSNINNCAPGAGLRKFEQGLQEALDKEQELLARLRQLPQGDEKVRETKRMIGLVRSLSGYREYPKYSIVSRTFVYKQALLREAEGLLQAGIIQAPDDIYYLSFGELQEVVRTKKPDHALIRRRKEEHRLFERLSPPRVMTSEGEIISGSYGRDSLPPGALPGLAVSSGIVEGRARVILNMEDAALREGDILVTRFTDPSWTPLFLSIAGLVTEVGGLMTHGAVIAREYGLPAVVGLDKATSLIKDGQRIRVNGTEGYVELL